MCKSLPLLFSVLLFVIVLFIVGCGDFGGGRNGVIKSNVSDTFEIQSTHVVNKIKNAEVDQKEQSGIEIYNGIPYIYPRPDHEPISEIIIDYSTEHDIIYLFDENCNYIGIFPFKQPIKKILIEYRNDGDIIKLNSGNRKALYNLFKGCGINARRILSPKVTMISGMGDGIDYIYNSKFKKIIGLCTSSFIQLFDAKECIVENLNITKIYNFKGKLTKTLTQEEVGEGIRFGDDQDNIISTYIICDCGFDEPDCKLKFHKFLNLQTGYKFNFNPFLNGKYTDYEFNASNMNNLVIKDSLVQFTYDNYPKLLRVICYPYAKTLYIKEYNLKVDFDGKYSIVFLNMFGDLTLPNGEKENLINYEKIEANK